MRTSIAVIVVLASISGCSPAPTRQPYVLPLQPKDVSWSTIRQHSAAVTMSTLLTGYVTVPTSGMLDLQDGEQGPSSKDSMEVPVFAHWLHHPERGDFLIDTGLDERFRNGGQGSYEGLFAGWIVEDSRQEAEQDIGSQLSKNRIDVQGVFLTHIHGDHTAGIPALPRNAPIIVGAGESLHHYPVMMYNDHFNETEVLHELDFDKGFTMPPFDKVLDVFGDQSLLAIATPGHTSGHVSFLVHAADGWVLLTGDASHTRWGFEHDVIPGWAEDADAAKKSLSALRQFSQANSDVKVVYGHER